METMTVESCISVDNWKLRIFEEGLKKAGHKYQTFPCCEHTSIIKVEATDIEALTNLVVALESKAQRSKWREPMELGTSESLPHQMRLF